MRGLSAVSLNLLMMNGFIHFHVAVVLTVSMYAFAAGQGADIAAPIYAGGNFAGGSRGSGRVKMFRTVGDLKTGTWGGRGISLVVGKYGSTIELDCADGKISSKIRTRKNGKFVAAGTLTRTGPGPIRLDDPPKPQLVRFEGTVTGKQMRLTITYVESGDVVGTFILRRDTLGKLVRCK